MMRYMLGKDKKRKKKGLLLSFRGCGEGVWGGGGGGGERYFTK